MLQFNHNNEVERGVFDATNVTDDELVQLVAEFLQNRYQKLRHHVAAGLVCQSNGYLGLHLDSIGHDICAEATALGRALVEGESQFSVIVALYYEGPGGNLPFIVPPCGDCRQLLMQYAPNIEVIVPQQDRFSRMSIQELLPVPYSGVGSKYRNAGRK